MTFLARLRSFVTSLVFRRRLEREMIDEWRFHLDSRVDALVRGGTTRSAAIREAENEFGATSRWKEQGHEAHGARLVQDFAADVRYGLRQMRRAPGFSLVVVTILALGIGLNSAVFSVVNAVLLRPLAFPHPERLVWLATVDSQVKDEHVGLQDILAWRNAGTVEHLVAFDEFDDRLTVAADTAPARIATVSHDFWPMTNARPALGHIPPAGESEVLLSWPFFETVFHADPAIIGKTAVVGGRRAIVAGVMPLGFHVDLPAPAPLAGLPPREIDAYHAMEVQPLSNGVIHLYRVVAQLKPGVPIEAATAELSAIHSRVETENPGFSARGLRSMPLKEKLVGSAGVTLDILFAAAVLVLLVGCANIASLLLARGSARGREFAVRLAMGAGRERILRQMFVESLVLATLGGAAGLLVAQGALSVVTRLIPQAVPRLTDATLNGRVLAFAAMVSVLTAFVSSAAPALTISSARVYEALKAGTRTASSSAGSLRARGWLVVLELALTVVLLCGAGLLVKSLWHLTAYPAGFAPERTLTATVQYAGGDRQDTDARKRQYIADVLHRVRAIPGVDAVGLTTNAGGRDRLFIEGAPPVPLADRPVVVQSSVSEDYARAIGMRLLAGRWVTDTEPRAVFVVNQSLAHLLFQEESAVGKGIQIGGPQGASAADGAVFAPIVGVVADLDYAKLNTPPAPEIFADYRHASPFSLTFVVRVSASPRATATLIRQVMANIDKAQPVKDVKTVAALLADSIADRRFTVFLLGTFAAVALFLALLGVYGVISYSVSTRTREIGVRMALGAERAVVVRMVIREGMTIALTGVLLGVVSALAVTRVIAGLLYDVAPADPATFAIVAALAGAAALAACVGPALKASSIDPLAALRCE